MCAYDLNPNPNFEPCFIFTLTCKKGVTSTFRSEFSLRCYSSSCSTCTHLNKIALRIISSKKDCSSSYMCFGREDILVRDVILRILPSSWGGEPKC